MKLTGNRLRAGFALIAMIVAAQAPAADEVPLEAFGRLPSLEDVAISPDGNQLALVRTSGDFRSVLVTSIADPKILGQARVADRKLRRLGWVDNENLLITVSSTSPPPVGLMGAIQEWFQITNFNVSSAKLEPFEFDMHDRIILNIVGGRPSVRNVAGHPVLFVTSVCLHGHSVPCLLAFSYPDRHLRLVEESPRGTEWLLDETGSVAAKSMYRESSRTWDIQTHKDDRWTLASSEKTEIDVPRMLGFNADGSGLVVQFNVNGDTQWRTLNLADKTWGAPLAEGATLSAVIEDRTSGRILGGTREFGSSEKLFFDNELQAHWSAARREFADEHLLLESFSDDFSKLVLKVFGAKDGYRYVLYDWYTHKSTPIGPVYDGVASPAEVKPIAYSAADGLTIPGFLTLPRGREPKKLPLVVLPHGGPVSADTMGFDWWAQAMAAQGYAVLQPNFRGSSLSYKFTGAGFGEFGRKMQTDLSDGVSFLAKQGTIDPNRVCIVGASYGGYAALAGVTLQSGIYRCSVSVAGISDLKRFHNWNSTNGGRGGRFWDRFWGVAGKGDPALLEISPIEHLSALSVPVLLIHGRDDTVVPYEQSDVMFGAAKRAGKSIDFVTLKREDHWLSRSETRLQMLQATVDFLKANNPPD